MIDDLLAKTPVKRENVYENDEEELYHSSKRACISNESLTQYWRAIYAAAASVAVSSPLMNNSLNSSGYHSFLSSTTSTPSFMASPVTAESRSPLNQITNSSEKKPKREKKEWVCETCNKVFDRPSLLTRHIRTHTGERPHVCDICDKAFSTSSSLNTHRRIHSGEKPHACNVCGKTFTASSNLYYHKLTHTTDKPHKCTQCSKSFATPGDLRCHMHVHNGTWPFRCDICNRGFSKQTNLKNHMLIHSGDKPFNCTQCDKQFSLACNLKSHLKTHHSLDNSQSIDNEDSC